jgi:ATP-dependent DNA helicase RecG
MSEKLLELVKRGESEEVEFKKSTAQLDRALKSVCSFLNHKGGRVYFGISNGKIVGQDVSDQTLKSISQKIRQRIKPEISSGIKVLEIGDKKIIEVIIREGKNKPYYLDGIAYKRVGTENVVVPPVELERFILEKRKRYFDSEICEEASLEDIDEEKVRWFVKKAKTERKLKIDEQLPVSELLERLELARNGGLTNAAVLLFAKKPQKFFLQAETRCARFKGIKPVKPFIDMKVFGGNIFDQVDKSLNFVLDHISMAVWLIPGQAAREERYEYPPDAVREAIINAICHRDYSLPSNMQIRVFDDRIEIWGCGPLPEPLTPEDLKRKHRSIPRNPLIAKCFFLIKYIEQWGTGTNDMIAACINWGLPEPEFELVTGDLVVNIRKDIFTEDYLKNLGLNERQIKAIEYLKMNKTLTSKKYAELFPITERTARTDLKELINKRVIERKGVSDKTTYYILAET